MKRQSVGDYILEEQIASGSFSTVWRAHHNITRIKVAIKCIPKAMVQSLNKANRFAREVSFLKQMDHPMISQLFAYYQDNDNHYLIMEYAENGDLLSFVKSKGVLIEAMARKYFLQIISVLEYLHKEKRMAHRDLKAENILLDRYNNIRVIDFGFSNSFSEDNPCFNTQCGSLEYVPPEMIRGKPYTTSADIWSLGVLLYAITCGKFPFQEDNLDLLMQSILNTSPTFPSNLSHSLCDLMLKMLSKNPNNRISIENIKDHPWFSPLEYSNVVQFRESIMTTDGKCDPDVVSAMISLGIDCSILKQKLFLGEFDEITAVYKMLQKEKTTDLMKDVANTRSSRRQSAPNSTPQPGGLIPLKTPESLIPMRGSTVRITRESTPNSSPENQMKISQPKIVRPRAPTVKKASVNIDIWH